MDNVCHEVVDTKNKKGVDINYVTYENGEKKFLKTWWDWEGEIPQKSDIVILHWGENSEESDPWVVASRIISGTEEKKITIILEKRWLN